MEPRLKREIITILVIGALVAGIYYWPGIRAAFEAGVDVGPDGLRGLYRQTDGSYFADGPVGYRFLDANRVEMLAGNRNLGTVTYTVDGSTITIKHACGKEILKAKKRGLYDTNCRVYVVPVDPPAK